MKQFNNINNLVASFEATFPKDYRKDDVEQILKFVLSGKFCQLICLPGGGKATVLKLLAYNQSLRKFHLGDKESSFSFIYLNLLELPDFAQPTIDKFLLLALNQTSQLPDDPILLAQQLKNTVSKITGSQTQTLTLLFDHFDEFQNKLPRSFFQTLRSLRSLAKYKFTVVFATRRDLRQLVDEEMLREFYDFFVGNTVYMKLHDESAITFMLSQVEGLLGKKLSRKQKTDLTTLTDGHTKLTKVCAEMILQEDLPAGRQGVPVEETALLAKPLVKASLFELWLFLTSEEQKLLVNVLDGKPIAEGGALENPVQFGLLKQFNNVNNTNNLIFTIPLFKTFVDTIARKRVEERIRYDETRKEILKGETVISDLLSHQEYRLLKFLIENQAKIIEREEIVTAVWPDTKTAEGISEAAIDQMVFRLRKKIEDTPANPKHLVTVKGRGFRFAP